MAAPNNFYIPTIQREIAEARFFDVLDALNAEFGLIDFAPDAARGGQYVYDPVYGQLSGGLERADVNGTLTTGLTPRTTTRKLQTMVNLSRTHLFEFYISEAYQSGKSEQQIDAEASRQLGIFAAKKLISDIYVSSIAAADSVAGDHDYDPWVDTGTEGNKFYMSPAVLTAGRALLGDQMLNLDVAIMSGFSFGKLEAAAISTSFNVPNVMGEVFKGGMFRQCLGMKIIADDNLSNAAGTTSGSPTKRQTLLFRSKFKHPMGLAPVQVSFQKPFEIYDQHVLGLSGGVKYQRQVQACWSLGVRGKTWDVGNGGANPDDATLATITNWDDAYDSHKDHGTILIRSN
jgi:hypothetical protein